MDSYAYILSEVCSNTDRQRPNINGAVSLDTLNLVMRYDDTTNADSTMKLFEQIKTAYPRAPRIKVICDNARCNRSKRVNVYLEDSRIELKFLPLYAPNLNLIERYWKYFKNSTLCNRYYETIKEFNQTCENFFAKPDEHRSSLRYY